MRRDIRQHVVTVLRKRTIRNNGAQVKERRPAGNDAPFYHEYGGCRIRAGIFDFV